MSLAYPMCDEEAQAVRDDSPAPKRSLIIKLLHPDYEATRWRLRVFWPVLISILLALGAGYWLGATYGR